MVTALLIDATSNRTAISTWSSPAVMIDPSAPSTVTPASIASPAFVSTLAKMYQPVSEMPYAAYCVTSPTYSGTPTASMTDPLASCVSVSESTLALLTCDAIAASRAAERSIEPEEACRPVFPDLAIHCPPSSSYKYDFPVSISINMDPFLIRILLYSVTGFVSDAKPANLKSSLLRATPSIVIDGDGVDDTIVIIR